MPYTLQCYFPVVGKSIRLPSAIEIILTGKGKLGRYKTQSAKHMLTIAKVEQYISNHRANIMMSWQDVSGITGPLWGESTGYQWIPLTEVPVMRSYDTSLLSDWTNCSVTDDFRRHDAHVMSLWCCETCLVSVGYMITERLYLGVLRRFMNNTHLEVLLDFFISRTITQLKTWIFLKTNPKWKFVCNLYVYTWNDHSIPH